MSDEPADPLLRLEPSDRARLGEALRILLDRGSILGADGPHSDLYHWAYANRPWLEEMCALFDLQLFWEHEQRLAQAVPRSGSFLLRLRLDATLVLLTLWHEFDSAVRDRGETPPIFLTAEQLNDSLRTKFEPLRKAMPSQTRLLEILRLAQRKNLVRFTADAAQTRIEILPTIRRVIPFQDIADWTRHAERFLTGENAGAAAEEPDDEDAQD
ncbi:MAG: DUF4194 domain-containing protein [Verrucomicrobiota bacterium]